MSIMLSDAIALLNLSFTIRHTYAHNQNDFVCTTGPMYHQLAQYQWLLVLIVTWTWKASITLHMKELLRLVILTMMTLMAGVAKVIR